MKMIEVQSLIRRPVVVDIEIYNPEKFDIVFDVMIAGDGLKGDKLFVVEARSSKTFELMYLPLKVGRFLGMITFLNERLGEIWYEVGMQSEPANETRLASMSAELGKFSEQEIFVENPTDCEVAVKHVISNPVNFEIHPKDVVLKPFDSTRVAILYTPT